MLTLSPRSLGTKLRVENVHYELTEDDLRVRPHHCDSPALKLRG